MKEILPVEKLSLLEKNLDYISYEDQNKKQNGQKNEIHQKDNQDNMKDEFFQLKEQGKAFKIKKGLSKEEETKLLQMVFDCGGILKTIIKTHDINLKTNIFLRDFFSLTFDHKKECHDISNALVSLSSKIKAIH